MPLCVPLLQNVLAWYGDELSISLALLSTSPSVRFFCERHAEPPLRILAGTWTVQCRTDGPRFITHNVGIKVADTLGADVFSSMAWWCNRIVTSSSGRGREPVQLHLNLNGARCSVEQVLQGALAFRTLVELSLRRVSIKDVNVLGKMPSLQKLDLVEASVADSGIVGLGDSNSLVSINLWGCEDIADVSVLGKIPTLRELVVAETKVTDCGTAGLVDCVNLRELNMEACPSITCVGAVSELPVLQRLLLVTTAVTSAGIASLGNSRSLVEIDLWGCRGVDSVNTLGKIPTLRRLDLFGTSVTNEGIIELGCSQSLEEVDLTFCEAISDVGTLVAVPTLQRLILLHTSVEEGACRQFSKRVSIAI
ncbi:uncharacterized protein TEOVI_000467700 [Trypanosoma equiperdum]|uniref:F-box/LRR-repeat protein 15-like leucin rich repeat domain-containing protein n=1 Tax=Trypanosoma equiperdum TaxID=5694 RepID=A0A1G4I5B1_TRYEQ|nr:hypothetical protein, conserved [Trypanosoma equiperdum]